jgi:hypothetical protein
VWRKEGDAHESIRDVDFREVGGAAASVSSLEELQDAIERVAKLQEIWRQRLRDLVDEVERVVHNRTISSIALWYYSCGREVEVRQASDDGVWENKPLPCLHHISKFFSEEVFAVGCAFVPPSEFVGGQRRGRDVDGGAKIAEFRQDRLCRVRHKRCPS